MKTLKETLTAIVRYGVIPAVIWAFLPFGIGYGVSRIFVTGSVVLSPSITIIDINMVCGILFLAIGVFAYVHYYNWKCNREQYDYRQCDDDQ